MCVGVFVCVWFVCGYRCCACVCVCVCVIVVSLGLWNSEFQNPSTYSLYRNLPGTSVTHMFESLCVLECWCAFWLCVGIGVVHVCVVVVYLGFWNSEFQNLSTFFRTATCPQLL